MRRRDIRKARIEHNRQHWAELWRPLDTTLTPPADMTDDEVAEFWDAANEPDPTAEDIAFLDSRRQGK